MKPIITALAGFAYSLQVQFSSETKEKEALVERLSNVGFDHIGQPKVGIKNPFCDFGPMGGSWVNLLRATRKNGFFVDDRIKGSSTIDQKVKESCMTMEIKLNPDGPEDQFFSEYMAWVVYNYITYPFDRLTEMLLPSASSASSASTVSSGSAAKSASSTSSASTVSSGPAAKSPSSASSGSAAPAAKSTLSAPEQEPLYFKGAKNIKFTFSRDKDVRRADKIYELTHNAPRPFAVPNAGEAILSFHKYHFLFLLRVIKPKDLHKWIPPSLHSKYPPTEDGVSKLYDDFLNADAYTSAKDLGLNLTFESDLEGYTPYSNDLLAKIKNYKDSLDKCNCEKRQCEQCQDIIEKAADAFIKLEDKSCKYLVEFTDVQNGEITYPIITILNNRTYGFSGCPKEGPLKP